MTFACPSNLPSGLTCKFSAPAAGAGGTVSSTLNLQLATPLVAKSTNPIASNTHKTLLETLFGAGAVARLAGLLILGGLSRRRSFQRLAVFTLCTLCCTTILTGCGGGGSITKTLTPTTTALTFNPTAPALGSPVTFTATVTGTTAGTATKPTGTVAFASGTTTLSTGTLSSGTATFTANALPAGPESITATYSGDGNYATSKSSTGSLDVTFATTLAITVSDPNGDSSTANLNLTVQ